MRDRGFRAPGRVGRAGARRFAAALLLALACALAGGVCAQQPARGVVAPGEAAVTGFSGAPPPPRIPPGADPAETTFIDPDGPSLRIVDLRALDGPPAAQLVGTPKPFTAKAAQIGQVFGVALDDATPPNVYAAATSAYGLPIVAPGPDRLPRHVKVGARGATFMAGLWGARGGPGSIWRIDGVTGRASLFAQVTTGGRRNSGAALGGLAYDPASRSLFVVDRESGLIHRFALNGADLGAYDHGVTGRAAQGLPPAPWTTQAPIDVADPRFDSERPTTWNYATPARRPYGLAVHRGRLYYALADSLQVWSVGLKPDGGFAEDAQIELAAPPAAGPTEISKIDFDEQGRMVLAERPEVSGAFDFEALAAPAIGRVLRYAIVGAAPGGRPIWQETPDEYAIGFARDLRNANGGLAFGYAYDRDGHIDYGSCGGFLWTTGEDLRDSPDPALAERLAKSGPLQVDGLQGQAEWRIRRDDKPPLASYFVSYADQAPDPAARGHLGDIAIQRPCGPGVRANGAASPPPRPGLPLPPGAAPPPKPPPPPSGRCLPGELRRVSANRCEPSCPRPGVQVGGRCCEPGALAAGGSCSNASCPAGQTPIGPSNFCCDAAKVYAGPSGAPSCCAGPLVNGRCLPPVPVCAPGSGKPGCPLCAVGYAPLGGACCLASQATSTGACCPEGQAPSGPNNSQCAPVLRFPHGPLCCAGGLIPTAGGACCAPANVTSAGVCCAQPVNPANRAQCPAANVAPRACAAGYRKMADGSCCNEGYLSRDGRFCNVPAPPCPPGEARSAGGVCVALRAPACAPGLTRNRAGVCAPPPIPACPRGYARNARGVCAPLSAPPCPPGLFRNPAGACVAAPWLPGPIPPGLVPPPGLFRPIPGSRVAPGPAGGPGLLRP